MDYSTLKLGDMLVSDFMSLMLFLVLALVISDLLGALLMKALNTYRKHRTD